MAVVGKPNHAQAVVPSDTHDLRWPSTYLSFMDASGGLTATAITIDTMGGEKNVTITLPPGMYPICATRVYATGTTATLITQYWDT